MRVKDRVQNEASKRTGRGWGRVLPPPPLLFFGSHFLCSQSQKSCSTVFLCSETTRKRLLYRLASVFTSVLIQSVKSDKINGHKRPNYFKNAHLSKVGLLSLSQEVVILYSELARKNSRGKKTANLV